MEVHPNELLKFPGQLPDVPESYGEDYFKGGNYQDYADCQNIVSQMAWHVHESVKHRVWKNKTLIDAGCAYGHLVNWFYEQGFTAYGFDHSPYAIEQGRKMYPHLSMQMWEQSVVDPIPKVLKVDAVTCMEVLEHVPLEQLDQVMQNFRDVARWGLFTVGLTLRRGEMIEGADGDKTHQHWSYKSWWVEFLSQYGNLDWDIMHQFTLRTFYLDARDISWSQRFFALEFV
jgi:cyclopropane fatty-acyl-phospholipid synthase-like methyltransferase